MGTLTRETAVAGVGESDLKHTLDKTFPQLIAQATDHAPARTEQGFSAKAAAPLSCGEASSLSAQDLTGNGCLLHLPCTFVNLDDLCVTVKTFHAVF